jgi:hypothetical protein
MRLRNCTFSSARPASGRSENIVPELPNAGSIIFSQLNDPRRYIKRGSGGWLDVRGDWTSGLGNLTRKGTRLRRFWSVDSASTKSRSFWEGKGWKSGERSNLIHLLSARASTCPQDPVQYRENRSTLWKGRGALKFSTCLLSLEPPPACEITVHRTVSLSPASRHASYPLHV